MNLIPTPSQTVGPFFYLGLTWKNSIACLAGSGIKGERLKLICTVLDGETKPVPDALIEVWQANYEGKYNHPEDMQEKPAEPGFLGFGRLHSDESGSCTFETIKPGRVPGPKRVLQAPHLNLSIFARGVLNRLPTRVYFADDPANARDPILALVPEGRRDTLLARPDVNEHGVWRFDIHLCGEHETVFFDI